ncbi:MAG: hypothetical protein KC620_11740, partial [Myxococcales bacterium]|nr:hypothetical protein [Myxococcales bacterium]
DGREMGRLRPGEAETLRGLTAGLHMVTLSHGRHVVESRRVRVDAGDCSEMVAWQDARPTGRPAGPPPVARR